jgi:Protein of unknown function (DUF3667)
VSHLKERKDKTCLNCLASPLYGRYCHVCGQENLEPKETVWHLIEHFFSDITHFDGKFFSTVKYLLKKPGFLSTEYMIGRRTSYLNPIRMYVFTSAIFFIIFFSFGSPDKVASVREDPDKPMGISELQGQRAELQAKLGKKGIDGDDSAEYRDDLQRLGLLMHEIRHAYGDTITRKFTEQERDSLLMTAYEGSLMHSGMPVIGKEAAARILATDRTSGSNLFGLHQGRYRTVQAYDSTQDRLAPGLRDGWFKKRIMRRLIGLDEEYNKDSRSFFERLSETWSHSFPKILFVSLPFFALILKLLYIRRKEYLYVDHGIFTIHVYCATFILMLAAILLNLLSKGASWSWLHMLTGILTFVTMIYLVVYLYIAMRAFYGQGRWKTFWKYIVLGLLAVSVNILLLLLSLAISLISI